MDWFRKLDHLSRAAAYVGAAVLVVIAIIQIVYPANW
jgi:hypothetical protein